MHILLDHLKSEDLAPPLSLEGQRKVSEVLRDITHLSPYPDSIVTLEHGLLFLGRREDNKYLGVVSRDSGIFRRFAGAHHKSFVNGEEVSVLIAPTNGGNAAVLRNLLPYLKPRVLGTAKSIGCGDRLGTATPGHIRAVRKTTVVPILAQQSVRENERTGRSPQDVLDDATWGAFQEGWRDGFGADADHLKTEQDIESFAAAGYTFFTIDPGDHVDNDAGEASGAVLQGKVDALPWEELETTAADLVRVLADSPIRLTGFDARFTAEQVLRAAAKYGRVVAHTVRLYRHLENTLNPRPFELEMNVDETDTVTSLAEHVYIAHELKRLGVKWVSLAPRYVGGFEKGVDYLGNLEAFRKSFEQHLAVATSFGPYKLSLHSGSDKLSIYPIVAGLAGDLFHVKTAGTSYLEALRTIAGFSPALFRRIVAWAVERYPTDRASYHVSAELPKMPEVRMMSDEALPNLLDDFHGREILHVTYGSVIQQKELRGPFFAALRQCEETYMRRVEAHFDKHLNALR
ncbi:MAG: hypothetical protein JXA41_02720 [Deltaproteobacteria bacterium]|nr:hypothetical protein [Deltaproteobacteria bacterium]